MKQINNIICVIIIIILGTSNYSNAQNWQLGGNPDGPPNAQGLLTNSNFLGGTGCK